MIKDLREILDKDLKYLSTNEYTVWEKLDMLYFRVEITKIGAIATKGSTGKVISDIDCIINDVYKRICSYVDKEITPKRNQIIEEFGEGRIGFFFLPVQRYHKILYSHISAGTVVLSDWTYNFHLGDMEGQRKSDHLAALVGAEVPPFIGRYLPGESPSQSYLIMSDLIKEYKEGSISAEKLINAFTDGETRSGNTIPNIEGIIIRTNKFQYQITLNNIEDNIDKSTKLIYRDTLLNSFAEYCQKVNYLHIKKSKGVAPEFWWIETDNSYINENDTYLEKICKLFIGYINKTDLFTKYTFDPEDLLPPTTSYIGDMDLTNIPNNNVKLACQYNELNKNIFRLLLHTFTKTISEDKFSSLTEQSRDYLNHLIIFLKYKNYKEILLTAYKAKC